MKEFKISIFVTNDGKSPFLDWLNSFSGLSSLLLICFLTKEFTMTKNKNQISWDSYMDTTLSDCNEAVAYLELALEDYQKDGNTKALMLVI